MIELKPLKEEQLGLLLRWRNDPRINKWTRQYDFINEVNHREWYFKQAKDPTIAMYGVHDRVGLAGVAGLTDIDYRNGRAEFSLYISPDRQGKGYGEGALMLLLERGFMNLGLNCIWGETFDGNQAAGLFERVGMKKEGTRREFYNRGGRYIGASLYSILRSEWGGAVLAWTKRGEQEKAEQAEKDANHHSAFGNFSDQEGQAKAQASGE